jgi:hypothetical protein
MTLSCDIGLRGSDPIIALCTSSHTDDHLSQVISKTFHSLKKLWSGHGRKTEAIPVIPSPLCRRGLKMNV